MHIRLHRRSTSSSEYSSWHADRSTCHLLLCRRLPISYKTRDPKMAGRLHRLMVSPVIPGVTTILFWRKKRQVRILKLDWVCILVKLLIHYTSGHKRKWLAMGKTVWLGSFNWTRHRAPFSVLQFTSAPSIMRYNKLIGDLVCSFRSDLPNH